MQLLSKSSRTNFYKKNDNLKILYMNICKISIKYSSILKKLRKKCEYVYNFIKKAWSLHLLTLKRFVEFLQQNPQFFDRK